MGSLLQAQTRTQQVVWPVVSKLQDRQNYSPVERQAVMEAQMEFEAAFYDEVSNPQKIIPMKQDDDGEDNPDDDFDLIWSNIDDVNSNVIHMNVSTETTFSSLSSLPSSSLQPPSLPQGSNPYLSALMPPSLHAHPKAPMTAGYPGINPGINPLDPASQYYAAALYQQQMTAYQHAATAAALSPYGMRPGGGGGGYPPAGASVAAEMQALQQYKDMMTRAALGGSSTALGGSANQAAAAAAAAMGVSSAGQAAAMSASAASSAANPYAALYAGLMGYPGGLPGTRKDQ